MNERSIGDMESYIAKLEAEFAVMKDILEPILTDVLDRADINDVFDPTWDQELELEFNVQLKDVKNLWKTVTTPTGKSILAKLKAGNNMAEALQPLFDKNGFEAWVSNPELNGFNKFRDSFKIIDSLKSALSEWQEVNR